jgi:hypothetical protein
MVIGSRIDGVRSISLPMPDMRSNDLRMSSF